MTDTALVWVIMSAFFAVVLTVMIRIERRSRRRHQAELRARGLAGGTWAAGSYTAGSGGYAAGSGGCTGGTGGGSCGGGGCGGGGCGGGCGGGGGG